MYRVLIADDESIIREGIKCLFDWESLGYTIAGEAANGETAYQQILALQPDIVLLDIRMPGMSGLDVIREARAQGFTGKVIILSGYSDFKYAQEAIRYGVQYYLTKPIDEDELEEILRSIKENLDKDAATANTREHYREKARETIIRDLLTNDIDLSHINTTDLHLTADTYQVVIYEKYSHNTADASYRFSDLLRVTNQDNNSYDNITLQYHEVILLKGTFAIQKFRIFWSVTGENGVHRRILLLTSLYYIWCACVRPVGSLYFLYSGETALRTPFLLRAGTAHDRLCRTAGPGQFKIHLKRRFFKPLRYQPV